MKTKGRSKTAVLVALMLALTPATALAQGFAQAVLYEVLESPPPRPSTEGQVGTFIPGPDGSVTRLAQATLSGPVVAATGSLGDWLGGQIDAHAQSRVDVTPGGTGQGPINGSFTVDTVGGVGATPGKLSGILDLSMLLSATPIPLAPVGGTWGTLGKASSRVGGGFLGVAQVPFVCGLEPSGICYLDPVTFTPVPLNASEFKNGIPLVRFVITLHTP